MVRDWTCGTRSVTYGFIPFLNLTLVVDVWTDSHRVIPCERGLFKNFSYCLVCCLNLTLFLLRKSTSGLVFFCVTAVLTEAMQYKT